jgi:hypothetical protein
MRLDDVSCSLSLSLALFLSVSMLSEGSASAVSLATPHFSDSAPPLRGAATPTASHDSLAVGTLISPSLARLVDPYVHYRDGHAILNRSVSRLVTPSEFEEVTTLISDYNQAPLALKTSGIELPLPGAGSPLIRTTPLGPSLIRTGPQGCSAWDDFQLEGWDGFQWFMNDCYASGLVEDINEIGVSSALAAALLGISGNEVAAGVAAALAATAYGAATFISAAESACYGQRLWLGLHYWVLAEHGCM